MTTNKQPLEDQVKAFKSSSSFTPGDALSFNIKFNNIASLPGRHDPAAYVGSLINSLGGRVAVICPGNGGLCIEAIRRGAESVSAFEPRNVYHKALTQISKFCEEAISKTFDINLGKALPSAGSYDTIFWTEGLEDIQHPADLFNSVLAALKPGGQLFIEVSHGTHGVLPKQTNSWKPSIESFEASLKGFSNLTITSKRPGRNQLRIIYTIKNKETAVSIPAVPTEVKPTAEIQEAPKAEESKPAIAPTSSEAQTIFGSALTGEAQLAKKRSRKPKQTPPVN